MSFLYLLEIRLYLNIKSDTGHYRYKCEEAELLHVNIMLLVNF